MRKYLVPLLLCSAIGAVVVVAVLANREKERNQPVVATKDPDKDAEASKDSRYKRPKTPTPCSGSSFSV